MYRWKGGIEEANEAALLMESAEDLFEAVEAEVANIHSYETFVLTQIPMTRICKAARAWMEEELKA